MMGHQLMTVCVFCVLCTSHSQCSLHSTSSVHKQNRFVVNSKDFYALKPPAAGAPVQVTGRTRRDVHLPAHVMNSGESYFIKKVFEKFGDGETMTLEGFEQLLSSLGLKQFMVENVVVSRTEKVDVAAVANSAGGGDKSNATVLNARVSSVAASSEVVSPASSNNSSKLQCVSSRDLFSSFSGSLHGSNGASTDLLSLSGLSLLCPSLLYQLVASTRREQQAGCIDMPFHHDFREVEEKMAVETDLKSVWLYSSLSILAISLCGLLGVMVIPFMQKAFYQKMLQFLVALAIGTLSGDALLHLLPHAMAGGESHDHSHSHEHSSDHDLNMWKGLVAALGVVFFFVTEKCLTLLAEWRKSVQKKKKVPHSHVHVMRDDGVGKVGVGEKLCKHKYSSYPYCYGEITDTPEESHMLEKSNMHDHNNHNHNHNHVAAEGGDCMKGACCDCKADIEPGEGNPSEAESYTVIIREHENRHHGHSHTHGHVHAPPHNMSSVAWMVIMGDGLHNFTDGMAIGAAFAANIAGGFSTSIAVFCHELPHEIGDFAVLLKAGMSARQAIFYNMLSSILCLFGMVLGIFLGTAETASEWIFSVVAGMFLYIALVDMIPELTTNHSKEGGSMFQLVLQFLGLSLGIGLMLLIANYEHDLKTVFGD